MRIIWSYINKSICRILKNPVRNLKKGEQKSDMSSRVTFLHKIHYFLVQFPFLVRIFNRQKFSFAAGAKILNYLYSRARSLCICCCCCSGCSCMKWSTEIFIFMIFNLDTRESNRTWKKRQYNILFIIIHCTLVVTLKLLLLLLVRILFFFLMCCSLATCEHGYGILWYV